MISIYSNATTIQTLNGSEIKSLNFWLYYNILQCWSLHANLWSDSGSWNKTPVDTLVSDQWSNFHYYTGNPFVTRRPCELDYKFTNLQPFIKKLLTYQQRILSCQISSRTWTRQNIWSMKDHYLVAFVWLVVSVAVREMYVATCVLHDAFDIITSFTNDMWVFCMRDIHL